MSSAATQSQRVLGIGAISIAVSLAVLATKYTAYCVTGSVALLADALETVINVVAACVSLGSIWFSSRPADGNHPYGHNKAEYLSAFCEGLLMLAAAAINTREVWEGWLHPLYPTAPLLGVLFNSLGGFLNLLWGLMLLRFGRSYRSPALRASGSHVLTDVYASLAVLAGFALIPLTGWLRIDPLVGGLVTLSILWTGVSTLRGALAGLMDELDDPTILQSVAEVLCRHGVGALQAHDLKARVAGRLTFVEFHLVVPAEMTVAAAHEICDTIEGAIRDELGSTTINIHLEPPEKAKPQQEGAVLLGESITSEVVFREALPK